MKFIALLLLMIGCQSCFLFSDLKKTKIALPGRTVKIVVPKKFNKSQLQIDSLGNMVQYYYYGDGSVLYFASLKDTSRELQTINYHDNIAKELYNTSYYKGLDSSNYFWRETRFGSYRAGYRNIDADDEGNFDSSINYFSLHVKR
jgi:hypothetical protein